MRIVAYRGKWCALVRIGGRRRRLSLGNLAAEPGHRPAAERAASRLARDLARPAGGTIGEIVQAWLADSRATDKTRLADAWKALRWHFAPLRPEEVGRTTCRAYIAARRAEGRADGTIRKELATLRAALNWHDPRGPHQVELPPPPAPKERWLTRAEFERLRAAAARTFHLSLFLHLAIATAARKAALLSMTWPQIRWEEGTVWLGHKPNGKRRATVPMTPTLRAALETAYKIRLTERVIEFEGKPIASIRSAFAAAAHRAGLDGVTPHVLRHTAGVWMAGAGVPLEKISEVMGHSDIRVTQRVYARFQPDHLRDAVAALDVGPVLTRAGDGA